MSLRALYEKYRRRYGAAPPLTGEPFSCDTYHTIVIPAYDELPEQVDEVMASLAAAQRPSRGVEVLVVVNAPAGAPKKVRARNRRLFDHLRQQRKGWEHERLRILPILAEDLPPEEAGVGLARRLGMDEAARRLVAAGDGIITSLDADTRVAENYLTALERCFLEHPRYGGVSLYFEHPLEGSFPSALIRGIIQYELHLRYFVNALRHCGHPHAFHTVGSAFSVRAPVYLKLGGMNRRRGGEDFYFIRKVVQAFEYGDLTETCVYPSPRPAEKVPFGTGPVMTRFLEKGERTFLTYRFAAFRPLARLFAELPRLYEHPDETGEVFASLPEALHQVVPPAHFTARIREIRANVATYPAFRKRFFRWFDLLKVIRYLNRYHRETGRSPVKEEASRLLEAMQHQPVPEDDKKLLEIYRLIDRAGGNC